MIGTNGPTLIIKCQECSGFSKGWPAAEGRRMPAWQCLADPVAAATVVVNALRAFQPSG
jgi:hypothetical protein